MKNTAYILGSIEFILGALVLATISVVKGVIPMLGRVAYQAAAAGSYSPSNYEVSFPLATFIAVVMIVVGLLQIVYPMIRNLKTGK